MRSSVHQFRQLLSLVLLSDNLHSALAEQIGHPSQTCRLSQDAVNWTTLQEALAGGAHQGNHKVDAVAQVPTQNGIQREVLLHVAVASGDLSDSYRLRAAHPDRPKETATRVLAWSTRRHLAAVVGHAAVFVVVRLDLLRPRPGPNLHNGRCGCMADIRYDLAAESDLLLHTSMHKPCQEEERGRTESSRR